MMEDMSFLTTVSVPLGSTDDLKVIHEVTDLDLLHKKIMRIFPDTHGVTEDVRSTLGILFRVDMPRRLTDGEIKIVVQSAVRVGEGSTQVPRVGAGDQGRLAVRVAAVRRSDRGDRPVPDGEAAEWVASLLSRNGFDVTNGVMVGPQSRRTSESKIIYTSRDVIADVVVSDETLANSAILNGIGRGKSYGMGLISFYPAS